MRMIIIYETPMGEVGRASYIIPSHIFVSLLDQMLHSKPEHIQKIVLNTTCGDCGGHVMQNTIICMYSMYAYGVAGAGEEE
jgi:hypothetical protein